LKVQIKPHCAGANNANNGVDETYVLNLLEKYEYAVIAMSDEHMCGFLFLKTKKRNGQMFAYIDLVCSSDGIGWKLLDFAEDYVHTHKLADVVYLHAINSKKIICMYAERGYREVAPAFGCQTTVPRMPTKNRHKHLGIQMSKCVKKGKEITTEKLYPSVCDPKQNLNRYYTPHGFNISKDERKPNEPSIQKPPSKQKPKLTPIEKMLKGAQTITAGRRQAGM
jgi:hypothetical protein